MSETISAELSFFLHAAIIGVILSAVYDMLRIVRRVRVHGCVGVAIEDGIYWLGTALYISYVLMKENNGVIRWFFVLGMLLGMLVYNLTISRYIVGFVSKIMNRILDIVVKVLDVVLKPLRVIMKKSSRLIERSGSKGKKTGRKVKNILKKRFKTIKIGLSKK